MGVLVQFVSVIAFTAWGLYVLADVKTFGIQHECNNQIKYVVFFFTIRATAPWLRGVWIAGIVLSAVGLMLSFGWEAMRLFEMRRIMEEEQVVVEKRWHFDVSYPLLLCVVLLFLSHYWALTNCYSALRYTPRLC
jgi:hypothetical protein